MPSTSLHSGQKDTLSKEAQRRKRENTQWMDFRHIFLLLAAVVGCIVLTINYLQLKANYTTLREDVTEAATSLNNLRVENDSVYHEVMSSVDLEHVRDVAMNQLGMVYPQLNQIYKLDEMDTDYVRQMKEIPED